MQYRRLGRSGLQVSALGLGTTQLRRVPADQAVATLRRAFELGINLVNTAPDYEGADALVEGFTITNGHAWSATREDDFGGGGVYMTAGTVKNCAIIGNLCTNGNGGGVYATGSDSLITDCRVIANVSKFPDGARAGRGSRG